MSEVPGSLTELKLQIGKDLYLHTLELGYGQADSYWDDLDRVSDQYYVDTAERWRATHPDIAEKLGRIAEQTLLELPIAQGAAVVALLRKVIQHATEVTMAGSAARSFYTFSILNGVLGVTYANAQQYLEALVAYGRGE